MFVLLAIVFALSFVIAGVGSGSTGFGSIVDALGGIFGTNKGSSGSASVDDAQKRIDANPKDAAAYRDLARAYELKGDDILAINALEDYLKLTVPKDDRISALNELAGLHETRARLQLAEAQAAAYDAQIAAGAGFGPDPSSPFGKALAGTDPIRQASIDAAQARYQQVTSLLQQTYASLQGAYKRLTDADPTDPSYLILYGQASQQAGDNAAALAA